MSTDADIDQWINRVQSRRRMLLAWRGTLAALAAGGGLLLLAAGLEWQYFLSDPVRWNLAALTWITGLTAGWLCGWSGWIRPMDARTIAAVADRIAPELKGDLLAAWELHHGEASRGETTRFASSLRQRVKVSVTERAAQVDTTRMLPWNLVRKNLLQALLVVSTFTGLWVGFGDDFLVRALRVGAPFLDLERVSAVKIRVVEPGQGVHAVAKHSQFELLVAVTGVLDNPPAVHVEGMQPVLMQSSGGGTFRVKLIAGETDLAFHVRAGDGMTKRSIIAVRERPALQQFSKQVTLPAYLDSASFEEVSEQGNLSAVQGSTARVSGRFTEPVSEVSVVFVPEEGPKAGTEQALALESLSPDGHVVFSAPVDHSGTYRIRAVSRAWGIESDPTLTHEVRALIDAPPTVSVDIPEKNLTVSAGSTVQLTGTISDDYRLKQCVQQMKWDAGRWKDMDLGIGNTREMAVDRTWNVPDQVPPAGGLLLTRLVAVDAKGNRSESRIVQIRVLPKDVLPSDSASLAAQKKVQMAVNTFEQVAKQIGETAAGLRQLMEQRAPDPARRNQAVEALVKKMEQAKTAASEVAEAVESGLKQPVSKSAAEDIALVAEAFNRALTEGIRPLEQSLEKTAAAIQEGNRDAALEASRLMAAESARAASKSQFAKESIRDFVAAREAAQLLPMAKTLASLKPASSATLMPSKTEQNSPEKAQDLKSEPEAGEQSPKAAAERALSLADAAAKALQDGLSSLADDARGGPRDQVQQLKNELEKQRAALAKAVSSGDALSGNGKAAESLDRSLDKAAGGLSTVLPELEKAADHSREQLTRMNATPAAGLETAATDTREIGAMKANTPAVKQEMTAARIETQAQGLDASAALEARKQNADPDAAALRLEAARALRAIGDKNGDPSKTAESVQSLARDLAKTEAAQRLNTLKKAFEEAARDLAFSPKGTPADPSAVEQARKLQAKAATTAEQLRNAGLNEAANALQSPSIQEAAREARKNGASAQEADKQALAAKLDAAAGELAAAAEKAAAKAADAAQRFASLAPKLPQALADAAQASAQAAESNRSRKQDADRSQLAAADREQSKTAARAESLRQALQAEADRKGVLSAEARAAARDAEDVSALIGDTSRAARGVERAKAASDAGARAEGLEAAANEQEALSKRLQKAADLLEAAQSNDPDTVAKAREALRAAETLAGIAAEQSTMESRKEQIAQAAGAVDAANRAKNAEGTNPTPPAGENAGPPTPATGTSPLPSNLPSSPTAATDTGSGTPKDGTSGSTAEWLAKAMESLREKPSNTGDTTGRKTGDAPQPSATGDAQPAGQPQGDANATGAPGEPASTPASLTDGRKAELALGAAVEAQRQEARMNVPAGSAQAPAGTVPGQSVPGASTAASSSSSGQDPQAAGGDAEGLAGLNAQADKAWGKLPAQMAKDLTEGKKESAPAEYQSQVEAYFKAIAERSARRK
jgi:hypothetical protein